MIKVSRLSLLKLPHGQHSERDFLGRYWLVKEDNGFTWPTAPRQWETFFAELLALIRKNPELGSMLIEILTRMNEGFTNQNQPSRSDEDTPTVTPKDPREAEFPLSNDPQGTRSTVNPLGHPNGSSMQTDRLENPSLNYPSNSNANTESYQQYLGTNYSGRKSYHGSLLK